STGPPPETIGSGASAASTGRDGDRITGGASTALHAVDIGGVLKISSISSKVTGALGGLPGTGAATTEFVIGTASVSGQPVTIDGDGVHAVGQNVSGLVGAQQQVDQALATAGIAVRTAPAASPAVASDGTRLEVSSSG